MSTANGKNDGGGFINLFMETQKRFETELSDIQLIKNLPVFGRIASVLDLHILPRLIALADEAAEEMVLAGVDQQRVDFLLENFVVMLDSLKTVIGLLDNLAQPSTGSDSNEGNQ